MGESMDVWLLKDIKLVAHFGGFGYEHQLNG